jgi:hypothetical protein
VVGIAFERMHVRHLDHRQQRQQHKAHERSRRQTHMFAPVTAA